MGLLNKPKSILKVGWSQADKGFLFRISIGRNSQNINQGWKHIDFRGSYLPYEITDIIIDTLRKGR
jgi:hypothetical protein